MHRLLVDKSLLSEESPALPKDAANHLKVLRPKEDEEFELFDGQGFSRVYRYFRGELKSLRPNPYVLTPSPAPVPLTLFACITKGSRWDWTIEKATELGVTKIVPVISDRTIVRLSKSERESKRERWVRIAEDAARQSDAKYIPEILPAHDFEESLELVKMTKCLIGALTNPPSPHISTVRGDAVFIGPEGDFTAEELEKLMKVATPVSFGPTILRAETAAIFAVSVISAYGTV